MCGSTSRDKSTSKKQHHRECGSRQQRLSPPHPPLIASAGSKLQGGGACRWVDMWCTQWQAMWSHTSRRLWPHTALPRKVHSVCGIPVRIPLQRFASRLVTVCRRQDGLHTARPASHLQGPMQWHLQGLEQNMSCCTKCHAEPRFCWRILGTIAGLLMVYLQPSQQLCT